MASGDGHGECTWNVWYGVCCPATCCNVFNTLVGKSAAARRIAAASTFCRFRGVSLTAGPTMPGVFPAGVPVHKPPLYYRCLCPPCLESFQLEYLYTNHLYITGVWISEFGSDSDIKYPNKKITILYRHSMCR